MTHVESHGAAFALLATTIPKISPRSGGSVPATVEVLSGVYATAVQEAELDAHSRNFMEAAEKLRALITKKGGSLPEVAGAAGAGYAAVWETVAAITAGKELPAVAAGIAATRAAALDSALHA